MRVENPTGRNGANYPTRVPTAKLRPGLNPVNVPAKWDNPSEKVAQWRGGARGSMYKLQELLESTIDELSKTLDHDIDFDQLSGNISDSIPEVADETAESMLRAIKRHAFTGGLQERTAARLAFEERLEAIWRRPIDLLDLFVHLSTEAGSDFNSEYREDAVDSGDAVFEALTKLHGRGCQVAREVLVLLRSGLADGAHARWRTLHEMAIVACLLGAHEQDLAERYLLDEMVQQYRLACQYQSHYQSLKFEPISQEEFAKLKERRDQLIAQFGPPFKNDYGWAASITGIPNPTLVHLEEKVELGHLRPLYRWASDNVHPNAHGTNYRLGLGSHQGSVILAGPSNEGLADPGHAAAISLCQMTVALLCTKSTIDSVVVAKILQNLVDEIGNAFLEVHLFVEALSGEE